MAFRVIARTLLHLGADLISSDEIALYELVKNSFDAGARDVEIRCVARIPGGDCEQQRALLEKDIALLSKKSEIVAALDRWKHSLDESVDSTAPDAERLRGEIDGAGSLQELLRVLAGSNSIEVVDGGSGMSAADLESVYLTIGTTHRLQQKLDRHAAGATKGERPLLGDKGVGRLAAMRLGSRLRVVTSSEGEQYWNLLEVDWEDFRTNLEKRLDEIDVAPIRGAKKNRRDEHGTSITITGLSSQWSAERLAVVARDHIAKLSDPFKKGRFPVLLSFNGQAIKVPKFDDLLKEYAHASCTADFIPDGEESRIEGVVDYRTAGKKHAFVVSGAHLLSLAKATSVEALEHVGPFAVEFYWFNRQALKSSMKDYENADEVRQVLKLQEWWAGGLMLYRDGFRVNPYGSGDDDWLNLDRKALASSGYKVNRRQIVGRVSITSDSNPFLVDQTNREGLKDTVELNSLLAMLRHVVGVEFKGFLQRTDKLAKQGPSLTVREVKDRVSKQKRKISELVKQLRRTFPRIEQETQLLSTLEDSVQQLELLADEARRQIESYEDAQDKVLHLAATGLLVEILAHELNRATRHTIRALEDGKGVSLPENVRALFRTLETQLRTLQKRVSVLDPLSTSGRQTKQQFDLVEWVRDVCATREAQFKRHAVAFELSVVPARSKVYRVNMVKGMLIQIVENLLDNSLYWLKQQSKVEKDFRPELSVEIDVAANTIRVTDNGPGVDPARRSDVFQPFYTTKPEGEGKGLGLFISREVAKYHKATLELAGDVGKRGGLNTFALHLGEVGVE